MLQHASHRGLVGVQQQGAEHRVEALLEREVEHEVERVFAGRRRELGERALLQLGARRLDDVHALPLAVEQPEMGRFRDFFPQRIAESPLAQFALERLALERQRGLPRVQAFEHVRRMERELHGERAARHRADQLAPARVGVLDLLQVVEHRVGVGAGVQQRRDHHRAARVRRQLLEEADLGLAALGEHEHASTGFTKRAYESS